MSEPRLEEPNAPKQDLQLHFEDVLFATHDAFQSDFRESPWYTVWGEIFAYRSKLFSTREQRITVGAQYELEKMVIEPPVAGSQKQQQQQELENYTCSPQSQIQLTVQSFQIRLVLLDFHAQDNIAPILPERSMPEGRKQSEFVFLPLVVEEILEAEESMTTEGTSVAIPAVVDEFRDTRRIPDHIGFLRRRGDYHPMFLGEAKAISSKHDFKISQSDYGEAARKQANQAIEDAMADQVIQQVTHAFSQFKRVSSFRRLHVFVTCGAFFQIRFFRRAGGAPGNPLRVEPIPISRSIEDTYCLFELDASEKEVGFSQDFLRAWEKIAIAWELERNS
ncbi:hypothetical protein DFH11DRAFT_1730638 [Phellopilus nigrolimitatus]|nr:hypothetical protein DFH11DRAFT_1730638 [Phellopilus nigrolimitatus]